YSESIFCMDCFGTWRFRNVSGWIILAKISRPVTVLGPGLLKYSFAFTAYISPLLTALIFFHCLFSDNFSYSRIVLETSNPHGISTMISGSNWIISSICIFLDLSPVALIPLIPPAISTICGTQWPAENNGSSHSIHITFGLEILDVSLI